MTVNLKTIEPNDNKCNRIDRPKNAKIIIHFSTLPTYFRSETAASMVYQYDSVRLRISIAFVSQ